MKIIMPIFGSLLLFSCCFSRTGKKTTESESIDGANRIEKVVFHHVSLNGIFTFIAISCDEFEKTFTSEKKKDTITDRNEIARLQSYIDRLIPLPADSVVFKVIDTRAKLYFISSFDTMAYCLNNGMVYSNGVFYDISDELLEYVENFQK